MLLQSKKHRLAETQHRRELQLKGDCSGSLRFALGRSGAVLTAVPEAEVGESQDRLAPCGCDFPGPSY